jgi:hypothetical protein
MTSVYTMHKKKSAGDMLAVLGAVLLGAGTPPSPAAPAAQYIPFNAEQTLV